MPAVEETDAAKSIGDIYFLVLVPFARLAFISGIYGESADDFSSSESLEELIVEWKDLTSS